MPTEVSRWTVSGAYLLATIFVLFPLLELFTTVWPFSFSDMAWRYGAFGISANYAYRVLIGVALLMAVAHWLGHTRALRYSGLLALSAGLLILPLMVAFAVDLPAVAELRGDAQRSGTWVAGSIQELKYALTCIAFLLLGVAARGTAKLGERAAGVAGPAPGSPQALRKATD